MIVKPKFYLMKDLTIQSKEIDILYNKLSFSSVVTSHSSEFTPCKKINCQCANTTETKKKPSSDGTFNNGRWTKEEHARFIEAMFIFGNEWKKVQKYIKTRSSTQSRSHSQKFFIHFRRKYIDQYGEEEIFSGREEVLFNHILELLADLVSNDFIVRLCRNTDVFFSGDDKASQEELKKIVSYFPFAPANLRGFIEEKKNHFYKIVLNLIRNPSNSIKEKSICESGQKNGRFSLNIEKRIANIDNDKGIDTYINKNTVNQINSKSNNYRSYSDIILANNDYLTFMNNNNSNSNNNKSSSMSINSIDLVGITFKNDQKEKQSSQKAPSTTLNQLKTKKKHQKEIILNNENPFQLSFEDKEYEPHCFYFKNEEEILDNTYLPYFFSSNN